MKTYVKIFLITLLVALAGCRKDIFRPPGISTLEVTNITATSAVCGGELKHIDNVGCVGMSWWTEQDSVRVNIDVDNKNELRFSCEMTDLTPNTKYYVQAHVLGSVVSQGEDVANSGEVKEFTTLPE